ncbi:shikimate dehydrogenase [Janibacter sp. Soil728]|uniref:shikimate dehydrogenase n=1 Tax=Janibacter sp. Soil728 TaxID=1736393 RepID=UPI0006FF56B9|nr:shikimate dehydrogenase [Janibacter sp. Soil728]KRE37221.1 shikimate dehydrogenase [Janibacter sp. Soil728]
MLSPTHHAGVLGSPIRHSLSPTLHRAGYVAAGLSGWDYTPHDVDEGGLAPFVAGLDGSWRGLSLTMPLKVSAFEVADEVSELAHRAGAINTLVRTDAGWRGDNTDVHGVTRALADAGATGITSATIVGSGATARSALLGLVGLGATRITVAARTPQRAEELRDVADVDVLIVPLDEWSLTGDAAIVSTVPGGPANAAAAGHLTGVLDGVTLLDVVYADWPTPLARAAREHGATIVSGLEMLVHQAARQFELFTGTPAPVEAMQSAGRAALGHTPDA